MRQIPLSNSSKVALVDDEDYDLVSAYRWMVTKEGDVKGPKQLRMGRLLFGLTKRQGIVRYVNGDRLDHRRENLRLVDGNGLAAVSDEELRHLFVDKGISVTDLHLRFGWSRCAIYDRLKRQDISVRGTTRREDLVGKRFGSLTVVEPSSTQWLCRCDCGTTGRVSHSNLLTGNSTSCGCKRRTTLKALNWTGFGEISGHYWYVVNAGAKARGLQVSVTIEEAWALFLEQDRACALTGRPLTFAATARTSVDTQTASFDRIDSSKGYIVGNVQWIHKDLQDMKMAKPQDEFVRLCKLVAVFASRDTAFKMVS